MDESANNIRTYTGLIFDPMKMRPGEVRIEDIAHALSMMTRANGHLNSFYSIAQHCLNCTAEAQSRGLDERICLACLLHDASECYIADIPRPVKHRLKGYAEMEERVSKTVFEAFGLSGLKQHEFDIIGTIDDALLYYEFEALTGHIINTNRPFISMAHDFSQKDIKEVEREFLAKFGELY